VPVGAVQVKQPKVATVAIQFFLVLLLLVAVVPVVLNQIKLEPMAVLVVEAVSTQAFLVVKVPVALVTPPRLYQAREIMADTGNIMEPRIAVAVAVVLAQSEQTIMHHQTVVLEVHRQSLVLL
jgi:hypothetical protein